jgi:hypothetical protein
MIGRTKAPLKFMGVMVRVPPPEGEVGAKVASGEAKTRIRCALPLYTSSQGSLCRVLDKNSVFRII